MKSWFTILFLLIYTISAGQEIVVKNNELLVFLYKTDKAIGSISCQANVNRIIPQEDPHLRVYNQIIVRDSTGLYILIDGTGRVYRATALKGQNITFERIDSTHFYGYNGYALIFSFGDTLFSLGGGGFWRKNGQLRYFSPEHLEWNIIPLNTEIPIHEVIHYNNTTSKFIYYLQVPYQDDATGKEFTDYSMYSLDLNTRINHKLGLLHNNLLRLNTENKRYVNIPYLKGAFVSFGKLNDYLLCFQGNAVYKLNSPKLVADLYSKSDQSYVANLFSIGNRVYYTFSNDSLYRLHSFEVSMKDFVKEPYPLYYPGGSIMNAKYAWGGLLLFLISLSSYFYFKKIRNHRLSIIPKDVDNIDQVEGVMTFSTIEEELIEKMLIASRSKKQFSVDDINMVLGLGRKTLEIQKKGRTEVINRINHKFKLIYDVKVDLIERLRSDEDRRFYRYIISEENARLLKK